MMTIERKRVERQGLLAINGIAYIGYTLKYAPMYVTMKNLCSVIRVPIHKCYDVKTCTNSRNFKVLVEVRDRNPTQHT